MCCVYLFILTYCVNHATISMLNMLCDYCITMLFESSISEEIKNISFFFIISFTNKVMLFRFLSSDIFIILQTFWKLCSTLYHTNINCLSRLNFGHLENILNSSSIHILLKKTEKYVHIRCYLEIP